jgi:uncharacterized membrane protein
MRFENQIEITAPIADVWRLTEDIEQWPSFTPTMTSVERLDGGRMRAGSRARVKQPGQRPTVWTVTRFDPPALFEWQTRVMGVTMTATHRLEAVNGGCRNTLAVELAGLGAGLLGRVIGSAIKKSIATENQAFKRRAEATDQTAV